MNLSRQRLLLRAPHGRRVHEVRGHHVGARQEVEVAARLDCNLFEHLDVRVVAEAVGVDGRHEPVRGAAVVPQARHVAADVRRLDVRAAVRQQVHAVARLGAVRAPVRQQHLAGLDDGVPEVRRALGAQHHEAAVHRGAVRRAHLLHGRHHCRLGREAHGAGVLRLRHDRGGRGGRRRDELQEVLARALVLAG